MISGLYSAATGMDAASVRHEASAENLANAHMPGYRRRRVQQSTFSDLLKQANGGDAGYSKTNGTSVGSEADRKIEIDFSHGPLKQTQRNLDVAIEGDGFFVVEGPDGPLYTRNGSFQAHPDGRLVTVDGLTVSGANGPIQIPANTAGESIQISRDGRILSGETEFGQLQIVEFTDKSGLTPTGASLFQAAGVSQPTPAADSVLQGFVESANVSHMEELVNIMVASRQYEAAQKAMQAIEQSLGRHINGN